MHRHRPSDGRLRERGLQILRAETLPQVESHKNPGTQDHLSVVDQPPPFLQEGDLAAKPPRDLLVSWVIEAWEEVPEDILRRGMESLILSPALAPAPPPLTLPVLCDQNETPDLALDDALNSLDTLGAHDVALDPNASDQNETSSESSSESEEEQEAPPMPPPPPPETGEKACMRCERFVRAKNSLQCPHCSAWYHVGCIGNNLGRCMLCA